MRTVALWWLACSGDDATPATEEAGRSTADTSDTDAPEETDTPVDTDDTGEPGATPTGDTAASPLPTLVPAFVAQGHLGRRVLSCDDGRSWVADQSDETGGGTCWSGEIEIECDHDPGAGRGVTWGDGHFFATFGWGAPGSIRRSADGVAWEDVDVGNSYGGVVFLNGTLLAAGRLSKLSTDLGATWGPDIDTGMIGWNVRRAGRTDTRFVLVGDADDVVTSVDGATWAHPSVLPAGCGADIQTEGGIAYGDGVLVILGGDGYACWSDDDGDTFGRVHVGGSVSSHLVWSGADFVAWGGGNAYRSPDGQTWTTTPISPANAGIGPVAVSDAGTFVAIEGAWGAWYEDQQAYRSVDGIVWTELAPSEYTGSHPIRDIAFGHVAPSTDCP
jgi:hypothetical protein